jgi:putative PIN family toxin of toxin-antitoxin system
VRVVFDSNILISALVFPGKQAEKALLRIIQGRDRLLLSQAIVDELLDVLARKFARDREELARTAVFMADLGEIVRPKRRLHVLRDEADNRILECAVSGQAAAIVTGDHDMLDLQIFESVAILSLRAYLES